MEQFVKMLYDRLASDKELQQKLLMIMDNAINEMHNNGIIDQLSEEAARLIHDPDPQVRVREKTSLAKSVGNQFVSTTLPAPSQNGLSYLTSVNYDPRFVNSITLCLQGGIESLYSLFSNNSKTKLGKYIIRITSDSDDLEAFKANIEQLDKMYDGISILILFDGEFIYGNPTESKPINSNLIKARKKNKWIKVCYGLSAFWGISFVFNTIIDYIRYNSTLNSAPFYYCIFVNVVYYIVPAIIAWVVGFLIKKKTKND